MNCTSAREIFPELLDPCQAPAPPPPEAHAAARAHLAGCPDCEREFSSLTQTLATLDRMTPPSPTPRLRRNFYAMLAAEKNSAAASVPSALSSPITAVASASRTARGGFGPLAWLLSPFAACALVAVGFFAGTRYAPAPAASSPGAASQTELADLRKKVDTMGQLVGYSLLRQQQRPANDRLRGVLTSATLENPTDQVLNDLIGALALDPSANVRLRALEALYPHADQEVVRAGVLASLPREQNPLVQVSMIDFLAAANDREAAPALERMAENAAADRSVRDAAKRALTQL